MSQRKYDDQAWKHVKPPFPDHATICKEADKQLTIATASGSFISGARFVIEWILAHADDENIIS